LRGSLEHFIGEALFIFVAKQPSLIDFFLKSINFKSFDSKSGIVGKALD